MVEYKGTRKGTRISKGLADLRNYSVALSYLSLAGERWFYKDTFDDYNRWV